MFRLDNKTAIVTGGGSGIGKAISKIFAMQGAFVFILDMDEKSGNSTAEEIKSKGEKANFRKCNISKQEEVKKIVEEIFKQTNAIHILVNNAGIAHVGNLETTTEEDFDRLFSVNVKGTFNCMQAVVTHMKKTGGSILNMASVVSTVGIPDRFAYSMTKGAMLTMTLSVAKDYIQYNIRCNCIS